MPGMRRRRSRKAAEREGHQHLPNHSPRGSRGSDVSMASSSRSRGPKVRREWRKKEEARLAWHESCNEKKGLCRIPEEKAKDEAPLEKGTTTGGQEPLEKGQAAPAAPAASAAPVAPAASAEASAAPAAASGAPAAPAASAEAPAAPAASAEAPAAPAASAASVKKEQVEQATPLRKGKVMVDFHWTLEVDGRSHLETGLP